MRRDWARFNRVAIRLACVGLAGALAAACGGRTKAEHVLDPANELPFGLIDTPTQGAQVPTQVMFAGWALDDRGIREVRLYVDAHIAEVVQLNTARPDVSKAYPQYARGTHLHGWTTSVVFYVPGPHTLIAQAVDTDGAKRDIGTLAITSIDK